MRGSIVFKKAAKIIDQGIIEGLGRACCTSMATIMTGDIHNYHKQIFTKSREYMLFAKYFRPIGSCSANLWWGLHESKDGEERILAMLFMEILYKEEFESDL